MEWHVPLAVLTVGRSTTTTEGSDMPEHRCSWHVSWWCIHHQDMGCSTTPSLRDSQSGPECGVGSIPPSAPPAAMPAGGKHSVRHQHRTLSEVTHPDCTQSGWVPHLSCPSCWCRSRCMSGAHATGMDMPTPLHVRCSHHEGRGSCAVMH